MSGANVPSSCRWARKSAVALATFETARDGGRRHGCWGGGCDAAKLPNTWKHHSTLRCLTPHFSCSLCKYPLNQNSNMPTTRSRARGIPENTPPQNLPAPVPTSSKWKSAKLPKNSEAARSNGADLLQTLLEEQEKELDEALGQKECSSHTRSRGRGRGRGHGCRGGRGSRGGSQAMTPEIADAETLEVDNLDTMVS